MRHQHHPRHDLIQAEINLMPLIDVGLVLLIVLLVVFPMVKATASPAVKNETQPEAATPGVLALDEPQLPLEILADGSLTVDGKPVNQAELHRVLGEIWSLTPNRPVIVKGDRHVRYAQVRWVLQSVNAAGFRRAGLTANR
ncbi:MAG TPA: biopolymer transporter ExbD [Thermoanaerobaculia bacterium]|jgi:biopolymer transport protein ExbD|nr:biopolymer transporter ExbD [Thermoanaerobaculia bacterium]